MGAPPSAQARTFISHACGQVSVWLLSLGDEVNHGVEVMVELFVVVYGERVAGTLDDLVRIGIVEREVALVLALDESGSQRKVVETSVHFTLVEGRRDAHRTIHLDAGSPETVVQMYLRERHLLDLLGCDCQG